MRTQLLKRFLADESGSPAIEYSVIASLIAVVLIGAFVGLGGSLSSIFDGNENSVGGAIRNALGS